MFFLIPIGTDAPIDHWPWATLSLIVANVIAFLLTGFGYPSHAAIWQPWMLEYGNGLNPVEWVSSMFLHFGFMHLIGNLIFLWGFGLVVEGKLGWWKYLLVYFGIGIFGSFVAQAMMLRYAGAPTGAGGASLAIFGLLAMSLVWAPKNEVSLFWFAFLIVFARVGVFELSILTFSLCYIGLEVLLAVTVHGFQMSSELGHLIGAAIGFGVGVVLLKQRWVDCQNWDLFAVMSGTHGSTYDLDEYRRTFTEPRRQPSGNTETGPRRISKLDEEFLFEDKKAVRQEKVIRKMHALIEQGKPAAALARFREHKHLVPAWQLDARELKALANGLYKARAYSDAIPLMEEYIKRFPSDADRIRIKLAGLLIEVQRRPRYALRMLEAVSVVELGDDLKRHCRKIVKAARRMIDDGVMELDGESW